MADVDWDKVAWDEPNEGGDEEAQAKARWQQEQREKVAAAMAHAIQQQTTAPLGDQAEQRPLPEEVKKVVQWADRHGCLEDTVPGHAEWAQREGVFSEVAKSVQVTDEQLGATLGQQGVMSWPAGLTEAEKETARRLGMDVEGIDRWLRAQCEDIRRYVEVAKGLAEPMTKEQEERLLAALRRQRVTTPLVLKPGVKVVPVLPLPNEVHPGNKGSYLLDEQGDVRTLKATAHPESLHIKVGNLEIVTTGKPGPAGIPFCGNSRILVDGKPFPVKSLVLRGNVDGLWTVEMEFYPRQPKE